jgi:hypothetical protein
VLSKLFGEEDPIKLAAVIRRKATRVDTMCNELAALETPLLDEAIRQLAAAFVAGNIALYMYFPYRRQMPARVRRFIDFVVEASRGAKQSLSKLAGLVS